MVVLKCLLLGLALLCNLSDCLVAMLVVHLASGIAKDGDASLDGVHDLLVSLWVGQCGPLLWLNLAGQVGVDKDAVVKVLALLVLKGHLRKLLDVVLSVLDPALKGKLKCAIH